MNNEINIKEKSTNYDVDFSYHSDLMAQNYDAKIKIIEWNDNRISIYPDIDREWYTDKNFTFEHSDPDRVIAIAQMILAAAQMVKNHSKKGIDVSDNV